MLTQLRINHFAVIEHIVVDFDNGASVLTGETGAGKSILLDALGLVLGDRADSSVIRHQHERAEITAIFDLNKLPDTQQWLIDNELDADQECILRRTISRDGRSKAYINGTATTLQMLRLLGEMLVDIHGQHEHQSLMRQDVQRQRLDRYAGNETLLNQLQLQQQQWKTTQAQLIELQGPQDDRQDRIDLLRFQTQELNSLNLQSHEWQALEEEHKRLAHSGKLLDTANRAIHQLYEADGDNVYSLIGRLQYELAELTTLDPNIQTFSDGLETTLVDLKETIDGLNHYISDIDIDPQRLSWLDERMTAIHDLSRKHRVEPEALLDKQQQLHEELDRLEHAGERIAKLQQQQQQQAQKYRRTAKKLSKSRQQATSNIAEQVSQYMQDMGMPGGQFAIHIEYHSDHEFNPTGQDNIEYQVSTNPGLPLKPLRKVASGGELSRISLAIQMATVEAETIPTLIFDEVDSGIGGGIAEVVGKHLSQLAAHRQVLCVTHLPQVAAQAHHHLYVSKAQQDDTITTSAVNKLDPEDRVKEVARMLGGIELTEQTLLHAEEMLTKAAS